MILHFRLTGLLVLLQALDGARLQNSTEFTQPLDNPDDNSDMDMPSPSLGSNTLDVTNEAFQDVPMLERTTPGTMENEIDVTEGNPIKDSPDSVFPSANDTGLISRGNSTGQWSPDQPEVSNGTMPSAPNATAQGGARNGTEDGPRVTPESWDHTATARPPRVNSASAPMSTANTTRLSKPGDSGNITASRGFLNIDMSRNNAKAWAALICIALAVGILAFIIYVALNKRNGQFNHRKLIEDMRSEPVLRLDSDPTDLKFDASAYYNPGAQGDHIQMSNFPQGQRH